ncbi:MAG: hypothetical protein WDO68_14300 [Gammaproteobacteria bacterium]
MRYLLPTSALPLAGYVTVASAQAPLRFEAIKRTVYLDTPVLEDLQKSNPQRYAQVRRIIPANLQSTPK